MKNKVQLRPYWASTAAERKVDARTKTERSAAGVGTQADPTTFSRIPK